MAQYTRHRLPIQLLQSTRTIGTGKGCLLIIAASIVIVIVLSRSGSRQEAAPTPASACVRVPPVVVSAIASGLNVDKATLNNAWAVRSTEFQRAFMVSAELDGPGLDGPGDIATWTANALDSTVGMILAVDNVAHEFSVWPFARETRAEINMSTHGVSASRACVRERQ